MHEPTVTCPNCGKPISGAITDPVCPKADGER